MREENLPHLFTLAIVCTIQDTRFSFAIIASEPILQHMLHILHRE
jgi:hypothetical protein